MQFIVFCSYHDGTTLGVDAELTQDYETLIKKFSGFCNYTNEDEAFALKYSMSGSVGNRQRELISY